MMRGAMLLVVLALAACDRTPLPGEEVPDAAAAVGSDVGVGVGVDRGGEVGIEAVDPLLCIEQPKWKMSGAGGAFAYRTATFWIIDVPCNIPNPSDLRSRLITCMTFGVCGSPIDVSFLKTLVDPFVSGSSKPMRVGNMPVDLVTIGGRTRAAIARDQSPVALLDALRGTSQPPSCGPVACAAEVEAGAVASGDEAALGMPCCPGCGPCSLGQCEPRPGDIIRNAASQGEFGCRCEQVCAHSAELPADCPCRSRCNCT